MTEGKTEKKEEYKYTSPQNKYRFEMYLSDDDCVFAKFIGTPEGEDAKATGDALRHYRQKLGKRFPVILDINQFKDIPPAARKIYAEDFISPKGHCSSFALHGSSFMVRQLGNIYARISSVPMNVCKSLDEAIAWTKEVRGR